MTKTMVGGQSLRRRIWRRPVAWVGLALLVVLFLLAGAMATRWWWGRAAPAPDASARIAGQIERAVLGTDGVWHLAGWAAGSPRVDAVEIRRDGVLLAEVSPDQLRTDVAAARPDLVDAGRAGFRAAVPVGPAASDAPLLEVVARSATGRRVLRHDVHPGTATTARWAGLLAERGASLDDVFYLPVATSGIAKGGAAGLREALAPFESPTVRLGVRVQILYLRTTLGAAGDYRFDPAFVPDKLCGKQAVAEDGLDQVIRWSESTGTPVLFTLNGGMWADASCDAPEWDVNDLLEQDERLCQWNAEDRVMPDNALSGLAGSFAAPELGRALSLNVYAARARAYKQRNLQAAAAHVAAFAQRRPDLFIGVNLDADVYVNPFFGQKQWYDYNPDTLRQFREWLQASGPYAGAPAAGVPDLSRYRRATPLRLDEVSALAGRRFARWEDVEPPRTFSRFALWPFWRDRWATEWEHFRRHLVQVHYDELARWTHEAGIPVDRIHTSQGFMPPAWWADPHAIRITSPGKNHDTGGVSIEGSAPPHGRLGAIVYGKSAANAIRMEGERSLFAEFRAHSPGWAVVEHNTADLHTPAALPSFADGYTSLRHIGNYGARYVSSMAWNASGGDARDRPDFKAYTALQSTPLYQATAHFMSTRAYLPRGALLWEFGGGTLADADGWRATTGSATTPVAGALRLQLDRAGSALLESPAEIGAGTNGFSALVIGIDPTAAAGWTVAVEVQESPGGAWRAAVPAQPVQSLRPLAPGVMLPLPPATPAFDRLRLRWQGAPGAAVPLDRVALYPTSHRPQATP